MVQYAFDATQHEPQKPLDVMPNGWYPAVINDSALKPTKAGTGSMINMVYRINQGSFEGRKAYANYNVQNPNPEAVEIANAEISAISYAVGVPQWSDTQQIHGIPLMIKLEVEPKHDDPTKLVNVIKGYKPVEGMAQAAPVAAPVQQAIVPVAPVTAPVVPVVPVTQAAAPWTAAPVPALAPVVAPVATQPPVETAPPVSPAPVVAQAPIAQAPVAQPVAAQPVTQPAPVAQAVPAAASAAPPWAT